MAVGGIGRSSVSGKPSSAHCRSEWVPYPGVLSPWCLTPAFSLPRLRDLSPTAIPHLRSAASSTKPEGEESLSFPLLWRSTRNISDVVTVIISSRHHPGREKREGATQKKNTLGSFFSIVVVVALGKTRFPVLKWERFLLPDLALGSRPTP